LNRSPSLLLRADLDLHQIVSPQLAVDREVEEGPVPSWAPLGPRKSGSTISAGP
jgi:hypothetical protein